MRRAAPWLLALVCAVGWLLSARPEWLPSRALDLAPTPRERLVRSLRAAGLDTTPAILTWLAAGARALAAPETVALPLAERLYFDGAEARAYAYALTPARGRVLTLGLDASGLAGGRALAELYAVDRSRTAGLRLLEAQPRGADSLRYYVDAPGDTLVLRIEVTPLASGSVAVRLGTQPQLPVFPVGGGAGERDVGSVWGDPRDGGRRRHEGIDVFAARGTPLLAAADATVTRVRDGGLGGKQVWLRTRDGLRLYYAHLDEQLATAGTRVGAGDTVGTVGNTGNARTTPPHLHFGVYAGGGAVDPFPFVRTARRAPPLREPLAAGALPRMRTRRRVRSVAADGGGGARPGGIRLSAKQLTYPRRQRGATTEVTLPGGERHWLRTRDLEALDRPLDTRSVRRETALLVRADARGREVAVAAPPRASTLRVVARDAELGDFALDEGGAAGWLRESR